MAKEQRTRRTPLDTRNVLTVAGKDPNYQYRIVNDTGDRVQEMIERGYEIVTDKSIRVGDRRIDVPTAEGSPVKVSVGGGNTGYVMRIKNEWFEEDQKLKAQKVRELEETMLTEARQKGDYGKIEVK